MVQPASGSQTDRIEKMQEQGIHLFDDEAFNEVRDETDHYIVRLPMEIASGDGFRVGVQGKTRTEPFVISADYLKEIMSEREKTHPSIKEWKRILLNSEPGWVQYKGLWGVKSWLSDESGPPGPKWDKLKKEQSEVRQRIRWEKPLVWLEELEYNKH
jgi:hypothetical protein